MESTNDFIDRVFESYKDDYMFDEFSKNDDWIKRFDKKAAKYFNSLTPEDAGYYSDTIIDYNPIIRNEIKDFLKTHTWQECFDFYLNRTITGLRICRAHDLGYTCGNSSPSQFGFYGHTFTLRMFHSYLNDIIKLLPILETDEVSNRGYEIYIQRDLGFGHVAKAYFVIDINLYLKKNDKLGFTVNVRTKHDDGFLTELDSIKDKVKKDLHDYKNNCEYLKMKIHI